MRFVRFAFNLLALSLAAAIVAAVFFVHLAFSGKSAPAARMLAAGFARVIEGQKTAQVNLQVRLRPRLDRMDATAILQVRSGDEGRRFFYFILDPDLRVEEIWRDRKDRRESLAFYRAVSVIVIDLGDAVGPEESVEIGFRYSGDPVRGGESRGHAAMDADEIVLAPAAFWYPEDLQGFFLADVTLTVPARLDVIHNGKEVLRRFQGDALMVRWTTPRPVPGLSLVAGRFEKRERVIQERTYRVFLPERSSLNPGRILETAAGSDALFARLFGPSGLSGTTLVVVRVPVREFHDGGGLVGLPVESFRGGDYGAAAVARGVARDWWGGSVGAKWLRPERGGAWLVDGFAEFAAWTAVGEQSGEGALVRLRERDFFDPEKPFSLHKISVFDAFFDPELQHAAAGKGAFVLSMLRDAVGEEPFFSVLRNFVNRFRYTSATDRDVEEAFSSASERDLAPFFSYWVDADRVCDVALETNDGGGIVRSRDDAVLPSSLTLWRVPPDGNPEAQEIPVGGETPLGNAESLVLDPLLHVPDMYRSSNVLPRWRNPRAVSRSARGEIAVVFGEPHPWAPAVVEQRAPDGSVIHAWEFPRGLERDPVWTADGTRILAVERTDAGKTRVVALQAIDGGRRPIPVMGIPAGTADAVLIARGNRILCIGNGGKKSTVVREKSAELGDPLPSPDGKRLAYSVRTPGEMELRLIRIDGREDRLLLSWAPGKVDWVWAGDGSRLYAVLPGDWDEQLWEIPIDGGAPRLLAGETAFMSTPSVAPDGRRIAFVAAGELDDTGTRRELFILDRDSGQVQRFNLESRTGSDVAWTGDDGLLVVVSDPVNTGVPQRRELYRVLLPEGRMESLR